MYESRKSIKVWMSVFMFGLTVGVANAEDGSADETVLDLHNQPAVESSMADLVSDQGVQADTEVLEPAVEPDCDSDTALTTALGVETVLSASGGSAAWTCGSCSSSVCANRPVGSSCGFNRFCVVSTICTAQPLTERCVCGTDHF